MEYNIKNVSKKILPECTELFRTVFSSPPWCEIWEYKDAFHRLKDIYSTNNSICLCCYNKNKIAGCLFGVLYKWHSGYQFEIREFFVNKSLQGKGIGKAILNKLEIILVEKKPVEIFLLTLSHSDTIGFYKSRNFIEKDNHSIWRKILK